MMELETEKQLRYMEPISEILKQFTPCILDDIKVKYKRNEWDITVNITLAFNTNIKLSDMDLNYGLIDFGLLAGIVPLFAITVLVIKSDTRLGTPIIELYGKIYESALKNLYIGQNVECILWDKRGNSLIGRIN